MLEAATSFSNGVSPCPSCDLCLQSPHPTGYLVYACADLGVGLQGLWKKMAVGAHARAHPTSNAAGDGEAISVVWGFVFVSRPGVHFFVSVSLKPFKTQLKAELLFLEGIERVLVGGMKVQE